MYKKKLHSLIILIPAFNELKNLKRFIKNLNYSYNILVIDDGSTDKTFSWLKRNKIHFKKNNKNLGYEKSLIIGFKQILKIKKYKYILTMDADGQHLKSEIKKFVAKKNQKFDLIVGSRSKKNRFIERVISYYFSNFFKINDPLSGFKLYKTTILKKIDFTKISDLFLIDLLVENLQNNIKIKNINVTIKKRIGNPRVGNYLNVSIKMFKILLYLFKKRIT
jgi:hypothetical protein